MDWAELGTQVAKIGLPLLGAVLPIPGGAAIGTALAAHLGAPSGSPSDIFSVLQSSADAVEKARQFQATHEETMLKIKLDAEVSTAQAEQRDRESARQLLTQTKALTPAILSWVVVICTFVLYGYLVANGNPDSLDAVVLGRILGTLDTSFGIVLAFWLGTSFSSRSKDDTIKSLSQGS